MRFKKKNKMKGTIGKLNHDYRGTEKTEKTKMLFFL